MQFPEQITIGLLFSLFAYGAILGASQIVAARHRLVGLSLLGMRNPFHSYLLGSTLLLLAYGCFFGTRDYEIFSPGPATSEFAFFLGLALLAALSTALLIPSLTSRPRPLAQVVPACPGTCQTGGRAGTPCLPWHALSPDPSRTRTGRTRQGLPYSIPREGMAGQGGRPPVLKVNTPQVSLDGGRGTLYLPEGSTLAPRAAICALPGLGEGTRSLEPLATHLAERGFVVLVLELSTLEYPDLLALIPSGVAYLAAHPEVDPQRIGVLGVDLGADLAIRSASGDEQVRAVAALSPILSLQDPVGETAGPGLHILAEMPFLQGVRWARATKELVGRLASLEHLPQGRPCLLLCGEEDRLAPQRLPCIRDQRAASEGQGKMMIIEGEKRFSLPWSPAAISLTADWFQERLRG